MKPFRSTASTGQRSVLGPVDKGAALDACQYLKALFCLQVSRGVHSKSSKACEGLYRNFRSFLSLPKHLLNVKAFLAVVKDSLKLEDSDEATISDNHSGPSDGIDSGTEVTQVSKGARLAHTSLKRSGAKARTTTTFPMQIKCRC